MALKLSSALLVLMGIALILPSNARDRPRDYLKPHNVARTALGLPRLKWDPKLAEYARQTASQYIHDCEPQHSQGPYGENLAWGSGPMTGTDATNMWVGEKEYYDYNSNSCAPNQECAHYTQVVWRDSTRLGCARIECNNGGLIYQCNYNPPGNYIGEKPY